MTVLFADLVGFTALADTLDPEELQELMAGIFRSLSEEALRFDGTIEKYIGDAIFVVFGAPVAHEDDAQRALRTALAMQRTFAEHVAVVRSRYGRDLALRIGVHTGIVVAGHVRSPTEYGVMGDTVNVAARLQQHAQPGETLVTQATFRLASAQFSFREVGKVTVKGKEQPILTYALTGEREEVRPSVELNTPLVGRWVELTRLELAYQSAAVGRAEFVALSGEPGIGKSRLANELLGLISVPRDGATAPPLVLRWTYPSTGGRAYAGFVETLSDGLGLERSEAGARDRVAERLHALGLSKTASVLAELPAFLGLAPIASSETADAEAAKRVRYVAVAEAYAALAHERAVVVVLEDLHHADSASLELLGHLVAHPPRGRLLFLFTYRSLPMPLTGGTPRANFTSLVLEALPEEEAARVVEAVLEDAPPELRERIVTRAGGNPFFIEEIIRSLIESGAAVREDDRWRVVRPAAPLEVPATLHATVAARIDRLPPLARECIQVAAVIGTRFGARLLREAAGPEVAAAVDHLVDADLVVDFGPAEARLGRYRFKHAITQEVAYQTLLVRRRMELHRRVAEATERGPGDPRVLYPVLARHYLAAEVNDRAAEYSWKAAEAARAEHAYGEALRHADQAAALFERVGGRDEDAVRALVLAGKVQRYRGDFDASVAAYQRALVLAERIDAQGERVRELYAVIAETAGRWGGKLPDLQTFIARGLELVGGAPTRERALLLVARAFDIQRMPHGPDPQLERALAIAREALANAEAAGSLREVSICLDAVGYAERHLGRFRDALATHLRRIPISRMLKESDELVDALISAADCLTVVGPLGDAIAHAREAREIAAQTGKDQGRRVAIYAESRARLLASDFAEALAVARDTLAVAALGDRHHGYALAFGAAAAAALGDASERELREALVAAEPRPAVLAAGDVLAAFYGLRPAADAYAAARGARWPSWATPRALFLPFLALVAARADLADDGLTREAEGVVERAAHERGRALVAHARGVRDADEAALRDALARYERLGLAFERALCLADLARVRERGDGHDEALRLFAEARAIAEGIGATALAAHASPLGLAAEVTRP